MTKYVVGGIYEPTEEFLKLKEENLKLKQQNEKLREALKFYASGQHINSASIGSSYSIRIEDGTRAKETLKERVV